MFTPFRARICWGGEIIINSSGRRVYSGGQVLVHRIPLVYQLIDLRRLIIQVTEIDTAKFHIRLQAACESSDGTVHTYALDDDKVVEDFLMMNYEGRMPELYVIQDQIDPQSIVESRTATPQPHASLQTCSTRQANGPPPNHPLLQANLGWDPLPLTQPRAHKDRACVPMPLAVDSGVVGPRDCRSQSSNQIHFSSTRDCCLNKTFNNEKEFEDKKIDSKEDREAGESHGAPQYGTPTFFPAPVEPIWPSEYRGKAKRITYDPNKRCLKEKMLFVNLDQLKEAVKIYTMKELGGVDYATVHCDSKQYDVICLQKKQKVSDCLWRIRAGVQKTGEFKITKFIPSHTCQMVSKKGTIYSGKQKPSQRKAVSQVKKVDESGSSGKKSRECLQTPWSQIFANWGSNTSIQFEKELGGGFFSDGMPKSGFHSNLVSRANIRDQRSRSTPPNQNHGHCHDRVDATMAQVRKEREHGLHRSTSLPVLLTSNVPYNDDSPTVGASKPFPSSRGRKASLKALPRKDPKKASSRNKDLTKESANCNYGQPGQSSNLHSLLEKANCNNSREQFDGQKFSFAKPLLEQEQRENVMNSGSGQPVPQAKQSGGGNSRKRIASHNDGVIECISVNDDDDHNQSSHTLNPTNAEKKLVCSVSSGKGKKLSGAEGLAFELNGLPSFYSLDKDRLEIRECMALARAIPEVARDANLRVSAADSFASSSNRMVFLELQDDEERLLWIRRRDSRR